MTYRDSQMSIESSLLLWGTPYPLQSKSLPVQDTMQTKNSTQPPLDQSMSNDVAETLKERGSRYGKFIDHANRTIKIKEAIYQGTNYHKLETDQREALDMIAHKIGRILEGDPNYADSWHDIAGYAKLVDDRLNGKVQ